MFELRGFITVVGFPVVDTTSSTLRRAEAHISLVSLALNPYIPTPLNPKP